MTPDERELARRIAGRFGKEREDAHAIIAHALLESEAELARVQKITRKYIDACVYCDELVDSTMDAFVADELPEEHYEEVGARSEAAEDVLNDLLVAIIGTSWQDDEISLEQLNPAPRAHIDRLRKELAAAKAEVERLRTLVEEAYAEGYRNGPFANWYASNAKKAMEENQMSEYTWLDRPDGPGWWWIEGRSCPYEVEADKRGNLLVRTGSQSWQEPQAFTGARFQRVRLPKGDAK